MTRRFLAVLLIVAAGCGGAAPERDDEVTETWTAGDDEPLDPEPDAEPAGAAAQSKR